MLPLMIPALVQGGIGLGQFVGGLIGSAKARRKAEAAVKAMRPDTGILDYYNKALARYSPDPYKSAYYQQMQQQIGRGLTTGLSAAQTRRGGLMSMPGLVQGSLDQQARAAGQAEAMGRQDLAQLGGAARMSAAEKQRVEDTKTNLLMQKWAQKAKLMGQGMQNVYGAAGTAASMMGGDQEGGGLTSSQLARADRRQARRAARLAKAQGQADLSLYDQYSQGPGMED